MPFNNAPLDYAMNDKEDSQTDNTLPDDLSATGDATRAINKRRLANAMSISSDEENTSLSVAKKAKTTVRKTITENSKKKPARNDPTKGKKTDKGNKTNSTSRKSVSRNPAEPIDTMDDATKSAGTSTLSQTSTDAVPRSSGLEPSTSISLAATPMAGPSGSKSVQGNSDGSTTSAPTLAPGRRRRTENRDEGPVLMSEKVYKEFVKFVKGLNLHKIPKK